MNFQQIWSVIGGLLGGLGRPDGWKASKDGEEIGPVTGVALSPTDARLVLADEGADLTLEARPGSLQHADVFVNGQRQDDARLVVSIKSQLPFKPLIVVLVFKHVRTATGLHDYRMDNPR